VAERITFSRNWIARYRAPIAILIFILTNFATPPITFADGRKWIFEWTADGPPLYGSNRSETITTDRPDFTESSSVVGGGVWQLEQGYTYTYDRDGAASHRDQAFPQALLRVGALAEWCELRLEWSWAEERTRGAGGADTASGAEDLGLGIKIALTPQEEMLPETAIILEMSVPSGSSDLTAGEVLPGINYAYGWELSDTWETGASSLFTRAVDDETNNSYTEFAQSWTLSRKWTEQISNYTEWFMFAPIGADTNHTQHYFDGGIAVLLTDNVQWDVEAGVGLNSAADDYFVSMGLSMRTW
jgi:hypothetical protein